MNRGSEREDGSKSFIQNRKNVGAFEKEELCHMTEYSMQFKIVEGTSLSLLRFIY